MRTILALAAIIFAIGAIAAAKPMELDRQTVVQPVVCTGVDC